MNTETFDPYDFSKTEIGGVPVYYKNMPWSPCINIRIVFNVGAFNDPKGKEGISHFLEHMLLNGCPSVPNKKAINMWSKENALNTLNAFTSYTNTWYTLKCLPEKYDPVLVSLKDMIFHSFLKSEDVETERKVIIQEFWNRYSNEKYLKYVKEFMGIIYSGTQSSRINSAVGWSETIEKITHEDIVSWHKENYGIGNFYIILTGAIQESHIEKLSDFLKDVPTIFPSGYDFGVIQKPTKNRVIKTSDEVGEEKEQVEISLNRVFKNISYEKSEIPTLYNKLSYDLLHEKLRTELSLCYGVSGQMSTYRDFSIAHVGIKTDEKNIELVEKEIKDIIGGVIDGKYQERFDLIKKLYKEQLISKEFSSYDITESSMREIVKFNGHIVTQREQLEYIEKATYDDIANFAREIFNPEYLVTEIILPSKK